jgi:UrcA family protein
MTVRTLARFTATLAAAAVFAAGASAYAETFESNGKTMEVRFNDLDLTQPAHQKVLRQRISAAAVKVCANRDLTLQSTCAAKARAHVKAPIATAIARAETKARYADAGKSAGPVMAGN